MSAAEQDDPPRHQPGQGAAGSGAASPPSAGEVDASFARLLKQLETEGGQPVAGSGVSQIFAPRLTPERQQPAPGRLPGLDAQAFAPRAADAGAFAPAPVRPPSSGKNQEAPTLEGRPRETVQAAASRPAMSSTEETFAASEPPATPPEAQSAGEFTRIFTQLPTPRSAPPAILADVSAQAPPSGPSQGEFTRFFQALEPARADSASSVAAAAAPLLSRTHPPDPRAIDQEPASQPVADSARAGSAPLAAHAPDAGTSAGSDAPATALSQTPTHSFEIAAKPEQVLASQAFQPAPPTSAQPFAAAPGNSARAVAFAPAVPATHPPESAMPPGAFTALFQAATPTAPAHETAGQSFSSSTQGRAAEEPAFSATFPASLAQPAPIEPKAGGGFTELLHSLGTEGTPAVSRQPSIPAPAEPFSSPAAPSPQGFTPRAPEPPPVFAQNQTAQTAQPPAGSGGAGEFTQLMQSLQAPQTAQPGPPAVSPAPAPFFGSGAQLSSTGPSEFTRIMQGSAARSAEAPIAAFAPAPRSSGGAVGLPIAAPQLPKPAAPALPVAEARTRLQAMMPWLLAANGALLLLLIALAVLFLRHHH